jgi:hypothetical protein
MNRILTAAVAAATLGLTVAAPASAAPWQSINQRQSNLYNRIEQGVRSGALNRAEAGRLRTQFTQLARLEGQYRRSGGLSMRERADLDRRFDGLSSRIRAQKHDAQTRRY